MIANITQGKALMPIINYNENKVKEGEATLLKVNNVFNNSVSTAAHLMLNYGEQSKRKDKYFHASINFPKEDTLKLNDELLQKISKEYLSNLGFPEDHPSLVYKHEDTEHPHIHIVTSKIKSDGKVIEDNHLYRRSQKITRDLEVKHKLTIIPSSKNSIPNKKERNVSFQSLNLKVEHHINIALNKRKTRSIPELQKYLNENNIDISILKGFKETVNGPKPYEGIVYNSLTNDFKQNQKGIKSSSLKNGLNLDKLEYRLKKNASLAKGRKKQMQNQISYMLNYYSKYNLYDFKEKLLKKDIDFNFKTDKNDVLVGVSFTDISTGHKYSGEKMGTNFKAKALSSKLTIHKTEFKPEKITEFRFKNLKNKLDQLEPNKQVEWLSAMGFRLHFNDNKMYISDYRNKKEEGYIPLSANFNITHFNIANLYIKSKKINFSDRFYKLCFEFNREKLLNNEEKMNDLKGKIEEFLVNDTIPNIRVKEDFEEYFKDLNVPKKEDEPGEEGLSDIDKKKKKRKGKKY